ncbi:MAG: bifunctional methylenetetrahydrofolate dehydrogenase/methenyltetrahydrofolate cyclohydrolase FolD [Myxococcales bacterium]|jgi:methylenetetrahydrofolate dehydrogenase (NADP+)/methenyltetrahydrofolate cyclohydrolase|nr:bifunctional methylenetetrahydrofolate dehydrogenase/methenyltetrahydrofolate cyclohydrolase FolD [Myxococcales bacterium]MBL0194683.1 bifunctional methylenetetrahydrofolate dehydrogenase/methenyltetrahydrofolate cyclohydrolase FolD [Myxococcales bacterium]HQY63737.1 bifunctional methylenetetrahydrofolate dehydrogenase/methenyltetrahydrofolate cyclohydrolase FolD [Polyangiaceae bacterium]
MATLLDGKKIAESVRLAVKHRVAAFTASAGRPPGLDVVLVGDDPASHVYVGAKEKASAEVGVRGRVHRLPADTSEGALLALLASLSCDDAVDGILVQLPLPKHIREAPVLEAISPWKDVDGFHPENVGLLALGRPRLVPCTPLGCMRILATAGVAVAGLRAVVVGRSNIVGKPVAQLLLAESATVTIAHSRTRDLAALCREADLLVAAVGRPELLTGEYVRDGAVVLDVGINRVPRPDEPGKTRLVGDVHFAQASERASAITPVPGGLGPMTIACLLENTVRAAELRAALSR